MPDVIEAVSGQALNPAVSTPEEYAAQIANDYKKWSAVIQASGFKLAKDRTPPRRDALAARLRSEVQQRIAIENAVGVGAENQRVNRGIDACIERIGLAAGGLVEHPQAGLAGGEITSPDRLGLQHPGQGDGHVGLGARLGECCGFVSPYFLPAGHYCAHQQHRQSAVACEG